MGIVTDGPRSMDETTRITDDRNPNGHLKVLKQRGHRYYVKPAAIQRNQKRPRYPRCVIVRLEYYTAYSSRGNYYIIILYLR